MEFQLKTLCVVFLCSILATDSCRAANHSVYQVPDEQRLYRELMWGYESAVRPVISANSTVTVKFRLTLNQIIDLDERKQVLTTNVFIDQSWTDENLMWNPREFNNIKTLRVHESQVWLPDTFLFNNADEGATGFMRGMYVLLNYNGTVLWPVPVKLKSSCKVDIAYFPFDDQRCQWRFGSWIYSGSWIDFDSSREEIDLMNFIDNSGWELISIHFQKNYQFQTSPDDTHPDLLFTLHIRRRTLFYIFNIIAPCVMLSVLTLLTFWLPTTSGEKISLGLSVFLAFSMFMLLIAEEVPATSNSVPLIGIYLTTVMTMTSVSVIMAVMVINLYNRGSKAVHAPRWVRVLVLEGLSRVLGLKHDMDKLTDNIKLDKEEEAKYACVAHPPILSRRSKFRRMSRSPCPSPPTSPGASSAAQNDFRVKVTPQNEAGANSANGKNRKTGKEDYCTAANCSNNDCCAMKPLLSKHSPRETPNFTKKKRKNGVNIKMNGSFGNSGFNGFTSNMKSTVIPLITITGTEESEKQEVGHPESPIWKKRDSVMRKEREKGKKVDKKEDVLVEKNKNFKSYTNNNDILNEYIQNGEAFNGKNNKEVSPTSVATSNDIIAETCIQNGEASGISSTNDNNHQLQGISTTNGTDTDSQPRTSLQPDNNLAGDLSAKKAKIPSKVADVLGTDDTPCQKKAALLARRQIVVEWQTIATVIDRLLFWLFLVGTIVAYLVILFLIPYTKPDYKDEDGDLLHALQRSKRHQMVVANSV